MSKVRGSYYVDGRRSMTLPTSDHDKLVDVGFRLVYNDAGRPDRGSSWNYSSDSARAAGSNWLFPINYGGILGIRLVWERP